MPEIDSGIRQAVRAMTAEQAHAALVKEDAAAAARLHANDTARLQRALEVIRATGRSVLDWRASRTGGIAGKVGIELLTIVKSTSELYARCDARVDLMIAGGGAVEEVTALRARRLDSGLPVMRAIGVTQLIQYLDGEMSLADATAAIKQATRNYAKRQRTWLRHQLREVADSGDSHTRE